MKESIDYEFWRRKLYPPVRAKKKKPYDTMVELDKLMVDLLYMFDGRRSGKHEKKDRHKRNAYHHGSSGSFRMSQQCTFKMSYSPDREKHKNFLISYLPQENKENVLDKPVLFSENKDRIVEADILDYLERMDDSCFRFMFSPESQDVPMMAFVRAVMKRVEIQSGYKLNWLAAVHKNTEHIHAHVLVNGACRASGKKIRFPKDLVCHGIRQISSDVCTQLIGPRTNEMIRLTDIRKKSACRFTALDERIKAKAVALPHAMTLNNGISYGFSVTPQDRELEERLKKLVEIGLAVINDPQVSPPQFWLETGWDRKLKNIGRYNTFLEARKKLKYVSPDNFDLYKKDEGTIKGVVTRRFVADDESVWKNAVVIENREKGRAWFYVTNFEPGEDMLGQSYQITMKYSEKQKRNVPYFRHTGSPADEKTRNQSDRMNGISPALKKS